MPGPWEDYANTGAKPASAARDAEWRPRDAAANLKDIDAELGKTSDPKVKEVLQGEKVKETQRLSSSSGKPWEDFSPAAPTKSAFKDFKPTPLLDAAVSVDDALKDVSKNLVDVAKLGGSVVGMLPATIADGLARMQSLTQGGSHKEQSQAGTSAYDATMAVSDNIVDKLLNWNKVDTSTGIASKTMGKITQKLTEEGQEINLATGGLINTQDFMSITNALMAGGASKGVKITADAVAKKVMEKVTAGEKAPLSAAVNDFTFGLKLPEEERAKFAEAVEKAEKNVSTVEAKVEVLAVEAETKVEIPTAGGLPKSIPMSLERAADLKSKPGFLLDAEEKIALKAWDEQAKTDEGYGKALEAAAKPGFERTAEDKVYLQKYGRIALAALGGLAAWEALAPEDQDKMKEAALIGLGISFPEKLIDRKSFEPAELSKLSYEELDVKHTEAREHNYKVEQDTLEKSRGKEEADRIMAMNSRGRNRWMQQNLTIKEEDRMQKEYVHEERVKEYKGAVNNFDTSSPQALGHSLTLAMKDADKPGWATSPEGTTVKNALKFAHEQGWDQNQVMGGIRERLNKIYGDDAQELFPRAFVKKQIGSADPKLLAILAGGMVGGYLGYQAFDSTSGGLIGALAGMMGVRAIPGMKEALALTPAGKAAVVEMRDRLYTLGKTNEARGLDMIKYLKENAPKDYAEHSKAIYEHLDQGKPLEGRAKEIHDQVIRPLQEANKATLRALKSLNDDGFHINVGEIIEDYGFHRVRVDSRPSFMNILGRESYPFIRGFSTTSPSALDRTVHSYTTASGESMIGIKQKGGKIALYDGGKVVAKGTLNPKTLELKSGDKVFQQHRASISNIEKQTPLRYYKEPLLAELDASFRLGTALNNAQFLKALPSMPGFEEFGKKVKEGEAGPQGWKRPNDFALGKYYFEPRMAEAINDFLGDRGESASKYLAKVNRILVGSLFWNPLPHIVNVLDHAIVEKGLVGLATNVPGNISAGITAYKEVSNLGPKYLAYLKEGGGLMYPDTLLSDFTGQVLNAIGSKEHLAPMARAMGYANPIEMVKKVYGASRQSLWKWNDIIMMQGYLVKEAKGMSKIEAMKEVEKHIPNYRLPERVLGSRVLQKVLADPTFTTFGRYDYGRLASYGNMVKELIGKDSSIKDRAHALDQMAMLGLMGVVIYPMMLDTFAQALTGNKNAQWTRFGSAAIPSLLYDVWQGKELLSNVPSRMFHVSPMIELIPQIMSNKDLHTGDAFAHDPQEMLAKVASHIAPVNLMQQQEAGKQTPSQIFYNAIGIRSPTDEQLAKKEKYVAKEKKAVEHYKEKVRKAKEDKE